MAGAQRYHGFTPREGPTCSLWSRSPCCQGTAMQHLLLRAWKADHEHGFSIVPQPWLKAAGVWCLVWLVVNHWGVLGGLSKASNTLRAFRAPWLGAGAR